MNVVKKSAVVGLVACGLLAIGAGSASAGAFTHSTTGVSINGTWKWQPRDVHQGAFNFAGTLNDTLRDGNAGKIQVRVVGYGYNTFYNAVDQNKYWNQDVWDPAAFNPSYAHAKICRDRGSLYPDNCSTEKAYTR